MLLLISLAAPQSGCLSPADLALRDGYKALEQGQFDQAIQAADSYLQTAPSGPHAAEAMYLRGRAIEQRPKRDSAEARANLQYALAHYLKALALSPEPKLDAFIRASAGNVSYWLNDYASAIDHFSVAQPGLDEADLQAWVRYRIGLCQQRLGRWAEADQTFASVQRDYPTHEASERARSRQGYRSFYVQVAAFSGTTYADRLIATLRQQGYNAVRTERADRKLYLVMVGPFSTYAQAVSAHSALSSQFPDALIVP